MKTIELDNKHINIFGVDSTVSKPLIILNSFMENGKDVWESSIKIGCTNYTLCVITGLDWNKDLSPWPIQPLYKNDTPFSGGADSYLKQLIEHIIPTVKNIIKLEPSYIGIAGYSLAGLFAVYSSFKTNLFKRIASASGSFWYPDFTSYVESQHYDTKPECIYFSLGNKEHQTKHKILRTVKDNTEQLSQHFKTMNIITTFELNEGNHFIDTNMRMAKGIKWILDFSTSE